MRRALPALIVLGALACTSRPRDVVLISVDTLRADHLGAYGYARPTTPAIDAFAAEATLFENAVPTCPATAPSVASLLTGLHRAKHGVVRNGAKLDPHVRTLASILRTNGYRTIARVANPVLDAGAGFAEGFVDFAMPDDLDRVTPAMFEGSPIVRAARHIFAAPVDDPRDPRFVWLHLMDPHGPYAPAARCARPFDAATYRWPDEADLPVGTANSGLRVIPHYQALGAERTPAAYRARYDGEIRCTDEHVAAILSMLRERGLWNTTIVILTADHGESLGEHGYYFQHGASTYDDTLRVPLIIRAPGLPRGRRIAQTVSLIDVAPTVLDLLGLPVPGHMEGRSLRPMLGGDAADRPAFAQTYYGDGLIALRLGPAKYVFTPPLPVNARTPPRTPAREELYDLATDPGETHDLAAAQPERLRELRGTVERWLASQRRSDGATVAGESPDAALDAAVERQLRALGYLE